MFTPLVQLCSAVGRCCGYGHRVASEVKEKHAIASWKRRRPLLITHMDALVADVREDVWRGRRRERVGRLNATATMH